MHIVAVEDQIAVVDAAVVVGDDAVVVVRGRIGQGLWGSHRCKGSRGSCHSLKREIFYFFINCFTETILIVTLFLTEYCHFSCLYQISFKCFCIFHIRLSVMGSLDDIGLEICIGFSGNNSIPLVQSFSLKCLF